MVEAHHHSSRHHSPRSHAEKLLSRFLILIGVIFILIAFWFSAGHTGTFQELAGFVVQEIKGLLNPSTEVSPPSVIELTHSGASPGVMIPLVILTILVLAGAIAAPKIRSLALQAASMTVWIVFTLWLIIKLMMTGDSLLLFSFFLFTTLIYLCFLAGNLNDNFKVSRRRKRVLEFILIFVNSGFYFLSVFIVLWYCGYNFLYLPFTALLAAFTIFVLYMTSKRALQFNRTPYILFTILVCAVLPPAAFRFDYVLLFLTTLSLLLLLFAKYTDNQPFILVSYATLLAGLLAYTTKWIFEFAPALWIDPLPVPGKTFVHGFVGSLFILATVAGFQRVSHNLKITLPKTIFSLGLYRKRLWGLFLILLYLAGLFIYFFILSNLLPNPEVRIKIFFSFNFLYFIAAIPWLSGRKSVFLPATLITAFFLNVVYAVLTGIFDGLLRHPRADTTPYFPGGAVFHYFTGLLFLLLSILILVIVSRKYSRNKNILAVAWIWFTAMVVVLGITEFDSIMVMSGFTDKIPAAVTLSRMHRIPYSIFFLASSLVLLVAGFIRKSRFLRIFSLALLLAGMLKILFYDLAEMASLSKSLWLFILGISVIGIAVVYDRVGRVRK
jgi:hypothetical protein